MWPKGEKLALLESYKSDFQRDRFRMYHEASRAFVERWGTRLPLDAEPIHGVNFSDPPLDVFPEGAEREAEQERHRKFEEMVFKVSLLLCYKKLG